MSTQPEATVYIIDDDEAVRDSLGALLWTAGFKARAFASGKAFLAACEQCESGCLVVDVNMPGLSGLELKDAMAAKGCRLPVIVITGRADPAAVDRALETGAAAFLEKPLDDRVLLATIRRVLRDHGGGATHCRGAPFTAACVRSPKV